jgi:hypothetical protein
VDYVFVFVPSDDKNNVDDYRWVIRLNHSRGGYLSSKE